MAWCTESDVNKMLNDMPVGSGVDRPHFINKAEDNMNAAFAGIYEIPITIPSSVATVVSGATTNLLQSINEDLAAGLLLLSLASVHEIDSLHSYAKDMEKRAISKIDKIHSRKLVLVGATADTDPSDDAPRASKVIVSSPDGKSDIAQSSSNATDEKSYFNRPHNEIANPAFDVDIEL